MCRVNNNLLDVWKSALSEMIYHICVTGTPGYAAWIDIHLSQNADVGKLRYEGLMVFWFYTSIEQGHQSSSCS